MSRKPLCLAALTMCFAGALQLSTAAEPPKESEPVLLLKKKSEPSTPAENKPAKSAQKPASDSAKEEQTESKKPAADDSGLDKELADSLDIEGLPGEPNNGDPLEDAIGSMRSVSDRIAELDTGKETQKLQTDIVGNLNKLLKQLQQQQKSQQNANQQQQQQQSKQRQQQGGDQTKQTQQQTAQKRENDNAKESTDRTSKSKQQESILKRRALIREIWGHLPPALRDKILNVESEKPLPKYAEHVRRYYESIAETP